MWDLCYGMYSHHSITKLRVSCWTSSDDVSLQYLDTIHFFPLLIQGSFEPLAAPPARLHLVCLDIGIFLLQTLCLFIAYEAHDASEQDEIACVLQPIPDDGSSNRSPKIRPLCTSR